VVELTVLAAQTLAAQVADTAPVVVAAVTQRRQAATAVTVRPDF
jgi:ABC-type uncharacterized transport system substrate-binding protein